jgi:vacuolar protein sorting-associated protein 29
VVEFCGVKIGLIHGHQIIPWADEEALENKARDLGVQLLISGHSHELKTSKQKGVNFINPGSMTGAYSALKANAVPSFMILEFKSNEIVVYEYSLVEGELKCIDAKISRQ